MSVERPHAEAATRRPQVLAGLKGLTTASLPGEVFAGFTLAALIIPLNIGYAQVAGLPPALGLYAALVPLVVFALFTSSREVVGGPGPASAALVAAALAGFAAPGDPERVQYALALAMLCGALFVLAWYFRLGFLQNFLSQAVMIGFVSGLGIQVFTNQLRKILGVTVDITEKHEEVTAKIGETLGLSLETEGYFLEVLGLIREIPNANPYAVALGLGSLVSVRLLKRYPPRVPGALVVLVVMTAIVVWLSLDERGVSVLGQLPAGLPSFVLPEAGPGVYIRLLPGAMALVAITLAEGLLLAGSYGRRNGYKPDGDQMLLSYGLANATAGLTGSMVTGNSVSRTAAMSSAGSRTQVPSLVAALVVGVVLAFFTDLLALVPSAALAGIVANAVVSLIAAGDIRALYRRRRSEFWVAIVCLVAVLVVGPLRAVAIAFLLSVIDLLSRAARPVTAILQRPPGADHFVAAEGPQSGTGLIIYRFSSPLFFANANVLLEEVDRLTAGSRAPVRWFVLDAHSMVDMDSSGGEMLRQIISMLKGRGVTFAISRLPESLEAVLESYELLEEIGRSYIFATNRDAAEAYDRAAG